MTLSEVQIGLRVLSMLADLVVIAVTWTKMFSPVKEAMKINGRMATSTAILAGGQYIPCVARTTIFKFA